MNIKLIKTKFIKLLKIRIMKFKEFTNVITLVKKGNVKVGQIGTIIHVLTDPEGYIVNFVMTKILLLGQLKHICLMN